MNEKPILFSGEMVRAILEGRKTQTRRALTKQPIDILPMKVPNLWVTLETRDPNHGRVIRCRYGKPGDRLWVKETFQVVQPWGSVGDEWVGDDIMEVDGRLGSVKPEQIGYWWSLVYRAQDDICSWWRPGIFMPRWASRITLEIVSVRVERVQDISDADAIAEGIERVSDAAHFAWRDYTGNNQLLSPAMSYQSLWEKINSKRELGWDVNPWVWVLEFKRVEQ